MEFGESGAIVLDLTPTEAFALVNMLNDPSLAPSNVPAVSDAVCDDSAGVRWIPRVVIGVGTGLRYPNEALRRGASGKVILEFVIDATGRPVPETIVPIRVTNELFVAEARGVLVTRRFAPFMSNGRACRSYAEVPFIFSYNGESMPRFSEVDHVALSQRGRNLLADARGSP
jgi:TonB family protein